MGRARYGIPLPGFADYVRVAAAEGMVLLKNEDQMLPILKDEMLSVFGRTQVNYYRSGTGSGGSVNVEYFVNAIDGIRNQPTIILNETLAKTYEQWIEKHPFDNGGGGWAAEPWHQAEMPLTDELVSNAREVSKKAVVIVGRTAGEDQDNADAAGSYRLTPEELDMLKRVTKYFENVAVILNVSNIIDMSWVEYPEFNGHIKAVLYSWHGGIEGGNALGDLLSGAKTPSGKLSDTIAYRIEDYPSTPNFGSATQNIYQEDIYVGYRYFETFNPQAVQYAFGYGLSYTSFDMQTIQSSVSGEGIDATLVIDVKVTNTGTIYSGKEVVQLYYTAPQGKLGKPAKVLGAFIKTKDLAPNENQIVSLVLPVANMASYDDSGLSGHKSAYVLEPGNYDISVGNSVKQNNVVFSYEIDELLVVQQVEEAMAPVVSFTRMKPGMLREDGSYELTYEEVPTRTVNLEERITSRFPTSYPQTKNQNITLKDVAEGRASLEHFIAQLSNAELAQIVRGEGMCSPKVTPGTASAFGGVTEALLNYGIPVACCADGPSGIRMDTGHKATQVPIGTLLASSWNIPMMKQLYELEGQELVSNQIDSLLGPGVNIHRHPLNGRNFEYFSEDPYLAGCFAAACTSGVKKGGATATVKHFAANDQETHRFDVDSVISERALREIHLKPFELAVKEGDASTIMTCYNPINGIWGASNYDLNTTILREEWKFNGIVMTDWWAKLNNPVLGGEANREMTSYMVRAQNDVYMVVGNDDAALTNHMKDDTEAAIENKTLTIGELQRSAMNICRFIMTLPVFSRSAIEAESEYIFKPLESTVQTDSVYQVSIPIPLNTLQNKSVIIEVPTAGRYQIEAVVRYDYNEYAQSACSLLLNDEYVTSIPLHGTNNEWVTQTPEIANLEAGYYELGIEFVKGGMEVGSIEFKKVD